MSHVVVEGIDDPIVLWKTPWMVDRYVDLSTEFAGAQIVEVGVHKGGSTRLIAATYQPKLMLAVDINPPVDALTRFLHHYKFDDQVDVVWHADQGDLPNLQEHLARVFGDNEIDLVIDDASHLLEPTRSSFSVLFPRLRAGGLFLFEDWSCDHTNEQALEDDEDLRKTVEVAAAERSAQPSGIWDSPVSTLLLKLVVLAAARPDIIESISLRQGWAEIRRGPASLDSIFNHRELLGPMSQRMIDGISEAFD